MHLKATTTTLLTLAAAAGLAAAAPVDPYPPTLQTKSFRLVINVTDPSKDITPPVHGQEIFPYFINSSYIRAGPASPGAGSVFIQYPNPKPSSDMWSRFGGQLLTTQGNADNLLGLKKVEPDWDTTPIPWDEPRYPMTFTPGNGSMGVQLAAGGYFAYVRPNEMSGGLGMFAVCRVDLGQRDHHGNPRWLQALDFFGPSYDAGGEWGYHVPEGCVLVRLVAQCEKFVDVPEGSVAKPFWDAAEEVRCYEDAKGIDWSLYVFRP